MPGFEKKSKSGRRKPGVGMPLKILTIDDDPMITGFFTALLTVYGMQVLVANDGVTGIQIARAESPDLILLDLMMPVMTGLEVCQEIRAFSQVPIIVVSAVGDRARVGNVLSAGANAFMEKPVIIKDLIAKIDEVTNLQK
jgi:DNA-binding response OmpR family regulator